MPKRFHDTEQLEKEFFMDMPGKYKILFNWIEKKHDTAGIWSVNLSAFIRDYKDLFTKKDIDIDEFIDFCNDGKERIIRIDGGKKIFLTTTIEFQYGSKDKPYTVLNENSPIKKGILNRLRKHPETQNWLTDQIKKGKVRLSEDQEQQIECAYCQESFIKSQIQIDHIVPSSKGGDEYNDNKIEACADCNMRKKDHDPIEFIEGVGLLPGTRLMKKLKSLLVRGKINRLPFDYPSGKKSLPYGKPTGTGKGIGKGTDHSEDSIPTNNSKEKNKNKKETRQRRYTYDQVQFIIDKNPGMTTDKDFQITEEVGKDGKKLWIRKKKSGP